MVQRGQVGFAQPLDQGQYSRVDKADAVIGVPRLKIPGTSIVDVVELLDTKGTGEDVIQERREVVRRELGTAPVVQLPDEWRSS